MNLRQSETLPLKILAILIAIVIWGWIQLNEEENDVKRINISYLTPESLLPSEELPKSISVELTGAKGRIRQIKARSLNMTIDLRDVHIGQNQRTIQESDITDLPDGIQVERFSPPIFELNFDNATVREIPIRANLVGSPDSIYKIEKKIISPPSISVRGPENVLTKLEYIPTKSINISDLKKNKTFSTQISLQSSVLSINQANLVDVTVELKERNKIRVLEELQLVTNRFDWEVNPTTISILVESEEDLSNQTQVLFDVDDFLETENPPETKSITVQFEEHPTLFSLATEATYTIKNLDPSFITIENTTTKASSK